MFEMKFSASAQSVIAPDLVIDGHLSSRGTVEIHGRLRGSIRCRSLIPGTTGLGNRGCYGENCADAWQGSGCDPGQTGLCGFDSRRDRNCGMRTPEG